MKYFQKIGKSLMLPVAVLPICGFLMGIGYWLCPAAMQGSEIGGLKAIIGFLMIKAGSAAIDNMSLLFVIGVSMGMSDDNHGASCLSGLVSWLVITTLLSVSTLSVALPKIMENEINAVAFAKLQNPFVGIVSGLIGAECYNRYKNTNLPDTFAFFSGRRFVAVATMLFSLLASCVLLLLWPVLFRALYTAGEAIVELKGVGVGIYAFLNRLLIPSGLHHALNNVFWFDTIGIGDLTRYWSGSTGEGLGWSLGMYMAGFFPSMMFGVPGAALAIYHCAKDRKRVRGILFSAALCSFICGLTEPFEFLFMFTCFPLYVLYAALYGIVAYVTYLLGFRAGFAFSGGLTDYIFSASLPAASKTLLLLPLGACTFALYYVLFRFCIRRFDIRTPGREEEEEATSAPETVAISGDDKYAVMAARILSALGGARMVKSVDCCATRLRLDMRDTAQINKAEITAAGALGVSVLGSDAAQVIIGLRVQEVCEELKKLLREGAKPPARKSVRHGDALELGETTFAYTLRNPLGIHARPAAALVKCLKDYDAAVRVSAKGKTADAASLTELMALGATAGTVLRVEARGSEAVKAAAAARKFLSDNL